MCIPGRMKIPPVRDEDGDEVRETRFICLIIFIFLFSLLLFVSSSYHLIVYTSIYLPFHHHHHHQHQPQLGGLIAVSISFHFDFVSACILPARGRSERWARSRSICKERISAKRTIDAGWAFRMGARRHTTRCICALGCTP